ncbi:MAG: N-acetyltransferase, partial [Verrucomicrobiota bacterium]
SGHLSRFSYSTPSAGVHLIHQARLCCAEAALAPALFVSVPAMDAGAFLGLLRDLPGVTAASATVYGTGLDVSDQKWMVCTSEI